MSTLQHSVDYPINLPPSATAPVQRVQGRLTKTRLKNTPASSWGQLPGLGNLPPRRGSVSASQSRRNSSNDRKDGNVADQVDYFYPETAQLLYKMAAEDSWTTDPQSFRARPSRLSLDLKDVRPSSPISESFSPNFRFPSPRSFDGEDSDAMSMDDLHDGDGFDSIAQSNISPTSAPSTCLISPASDVTSSRRASLLPAALSLRRDSLESEVEVMPPEHCSQNSLSNSESAPAESEEVLPQENLVVFEPKESEFPRDLEVGYTRHLLRQVFGDDRGTTIAILLAIVMPPLISSLFAVSLPAFLLTTFTVAVVHYTYRNILFWRDHIRPLPTSGAPETQPFLSRKLVVRDHHAIEGKRVWVPKITVDDVERRAFSDLGMSLWAYLRDLFTWNLEYKIQAIWRVVATDLRIGRYARRTSTQSDVFEVVLNSTLACWIDVETGHAVFYDTILPWKQDQTKNWHKITIELDHDQKICLCMKLQERAAAPGERPEVLLVTDMTEIATIASQIGALKAHVQCHWWANGVAEMGEHWSKTQQASEMVQGLNNGAVFSTGGLYMTDKMAPILGTNAVVEGFPMHGDLSLIARNSKFHKMSMLARRRLYELLPDVSKMHLEALLAASIMHSADHYYGDELAPWVGRSQVLQTDFTFARCAFMGPNKYYTRKLLCRQHMDDPICAILYRSAVEVDRKFADEALFFSVAN